MAVTACSAAWRLKPTNRYRIGTKITPRAPFRSPVVSTCVRTKRHQQKDPHKPVSCFHQKLRIMPAASSSTVGLKSGPGFHTQVAIRGCHDKEQLTAFHGEAGGNQTRRVDDAFAVTEKTDRPAAFLELIQLRTMLGNCGANSVTATRRRHKRPETIVRRGIARRRHALRHASTTAADGPPGEIAVGAERAPHPVTQRKRMRPDHNASRIGQRRSKRKMQVATFSQPVREKCRYTGRLPATRWHSTLPEPRRAPQQDVERNQRENNCRATAGRRSVSTDMPARMNA